MAAGARAEASKAKQAPAGAAAQAVVPDVNPAEIVQQLEAAKGNRQALDGLASRVADYTVPLHHGLGPQELAPVSLAKQFAPTLVKLAKLSFDLLDQSVSDGQDAEEVAQSCCLVLTGLSRARLAIKGRPLEVELQAYALVRKLVAAKMHRKAMGLAALLYASVIDHCKGSDQGHTIGKWSSQQWPTATGEGAHDKQAPALLVMALMNAILSAVAGYHSEELVTELGRISPALAGMSSWLKLLPSSEASQYRDSILRHAVKGASLAAAHCKSAGKEGVQTLAAASDFCAAVSELCFSCCGQSQATKVVVKMATELPALEGVQLAAKSIDTAMKGDKVSAVEGMLALDAFVSICEKLDAWAEGARLLGQRRRLYKSSPVLGVYPAIIGVMMAQSKSDVSQPPNSSLEKGTKGTASSKKPPKTKDGKTAQPFDHLEGALSHVEDVISSKTATTAELYNCFKALNALRKAIKHPETLLADMEVAGIHGTLNGLKLAARAADLLIPAVSAGAARELKLNPVQPCLANPHSWSCAVAAAVQGAKLRAAACQAGLLDPGEWLCSPSVCCHLWRSLETPGAVPKTEELKWLSMSMHNIGQTFQGQALAVEPLEIAYEASTAVAILLSVEADSSATAQAILDATMRGQVAARAMASAGRSDQAIAFAGSELAAVLRRGWDGALMAQTFVSVCKGMEGPQSSWLDLLPAELGKEVELWQIRLSLVNGAMREAERCRPGERLLHELFTIGVGLLGCREGPQLARAQVGCQLMACASCWGRPSENEHLPSPKAVIALLEECKQQRDVSTADAAGCEAALSMVTFWQSLETPETDSVSSRDWESTEKALGVLSELIEGYSEAMCGGWEQRWALGRQQVLWTLMELCCMCSLHGRCELQQATLKVCIRLADLWASGNSQSASGSLGYLPRVLAALPSLCSINAVDVLQTLPLAYETNSYAETFRNLCEQHRFWLAVEGGDYRQLYDSLSAAARAVAADTSGPARLLSVVRAWTHLRAGAAARSAGLVQQGIAEVKEALRLSSALCQGLELNSSCSQKRSNKAHQDSAGEAEELPQRPSQAAVCPLEAACTGSGRWQSRLLQLSSLLALGQLHELSGCADEASSALRSGLSRAKNIGTEDAVAKFSTLLAHVYRKRRKWEQCREMLALVSSARSSAMCSRCVAWASSAAAQVAGDRARHTGDTESARKIYMKSLEECAGVDAVGLESSSCLVAQAQAGVAKCGSAEGDTEVARHAALQGLQALGCGVTDRWCLLEPTRRSCNAPLEASLLWQLARSLWMDYLHEAAGHSVMAQPQLWAPQSAAAAAPSQAKPLRRAAARASKPSPPAAAEPSESLGLLQLLVRAYSLSLQVPLLRRRVALALATLTQPAAATVFFHVSMGATVQQQFHASVSGRTSEGTGGTVDTANLEEALGLLEAPDPGLGIFDKHIASVATAKQSGRAKRPAKSTAVSSEAEELLRALEEWGAIYLSRQAAFVPEGTVVCGLGVLPQVAEGEGGSLLLNRWAPGQQPLLLRLPLPECPQELETKSCSSPAVSGAVAKFRETLFNSAEMVKNCGPLESAAQKKKWWQHRMDLDSALMGQIGGLETDWLGPLAFLLLPSLLQLEEIETALPCLEAVGDMSSLCPSKGAMVQGVVKALLCASTVLSTEAVRASAASIVRLAGQSPEDTGAAMVTQLMEAAEALGKSRWGGNAPPVQDPDGAPSRSAMLLKRMAQGKDVDEEDVSSQASGSGSSAPPPTRRSARAAPAAPTKGTRRRTRMAAMSAEDDEDTEQPDSSSNLKAQSPPPRRPSISSQQSTTSTADTSLLTKKASISSTPAVQGCNSVILVLDSDLQPLPWESLPSIKRSNVYRSPSLACATALMCRLQTGQEGSLLNDSVVDLSSTFYMLNPSKDLSDTQKEFEGWFLEQTTWDGLVAATAPTEELASKLENRDMFIYFGHGGGEQFLPARRLRQMTSCPAALLMGCSSGRLRDCGEYEATGVVLAYLLAGCPAAVANLWDVTDRDIDRFSRSVLEEWMAAPRPEAGNSSPTPYLPLSLAQSMAANRTSCRLPFLTGAAPVCYGVPTTVIGITGRNSTAA